MNEPVKVKVEGYNIQTYGAEGFSDVWIVDFAKMQILDAERRPISDLRRNDLGGWDLVMPGSPVKAIRPEAHTSPMSVALEEAYIRWLAKEITG